MTTGKDISNHLKAYIDKLDKDISQLFEKGYKSDVALKAVISILLKKELMADREFEREIRSIRKRVREE